MKKAPLFELPDQDGQIHKLQDHIGNWIVVYFYPKDDTPKCTKEACSFRDAEEDLVQNNIKVFGISADDINSHKKFHTKHNLNFPILSDESKETIKNFGAWGEKKMFGKAYMGIMRYTYVINPDGNIAKVFEKVKDTDVHTQEILQFINENS